MEQNGAEWCRLDITMGQNGMEQIKSRMESRMKQNGADWNRMEQSGADWTEIRMESRMD
jgi:hypothetical protein